MALTKDLRKQFAPGSCAILLSAENFFGREWRVSLPGTWKRERVCCATTSMQPLVSTNWQR